MSTEQKKPEDGKLAQFVARYPLYVKIGFGMVIAFGMVGNCAGHREGSVIIFVLTATLWACTRIIQEAIEAWRVLTLAKAHDKSKDKKDEPPQPPEPPAAA